MRRKTKPKAIALTVLLAAVAPPIATAIEQGQNAATDRSQVQTPQDSKTLAEGRFVEDTTGGEPLLVIDEKSGTLGPIGRPARLGEPHSLRAVDPAEMGVTELVRFEDRDDSQPAPSGAAAERQPSGAVRNAGQAPVEPN